MRKLFSHFDICLKQNKLGYEYVFQPNTYSLRSFSKGRGSSKRPSRLYIGSDPPALKGLKPGYAVGGGVKLTPSLQIRSFKDKCEHRFYIFGKLLYIYANSDLPKHKWFLKKMHSFRIRRVNICNL